MIQTIGFSQFCDAFNHAGRKDQFSYQAKRVLFDYLDETGEGNDEYDLDVIALCCEYSESTVQDVASDYSIDIDGNTHDEARGLVMEYLDEQTTVCGTTADGAIVYAQF